MLALLERSLRGDEQIDRRAQLVLVLEALTDEFRVRIAQGQVLGDSGGMAAAPSVATPYELRKHYNDECKSVRTALLPVDVDPFLAQVKDTPTDKELQELFETHKKDERNPRLDRPGFMTPKHVKLEFIAGKVDSPHFRKLGQENSAKDGVLIAAATGAAHSTLQSRATWTIRRAGSIRATSPTGCPHASTGARPRA